MSDHEWDCDKFTHPKFVYRRDDRWEGEDEKDVKDNWDDEDEELKKEEEEKKVKSELIKVVKKKKNEIKEEKNNDFERVKTPAEILSDKLEKQRLQEEFDLTLAKEAFGITSENLTDFNVSTKESLDQLSKNLVLKIQSLEKSPLYVSFLEKFFRELCVNLNVADIKKISSNLNALYNEKFKAQKNAKSKRKGSKAASIRVERDDFIIDDYDDDFDEFI